MGTSKQAIIQGCGRSLTRQSTRERGQETISDFGILVPVGRGKLLFLAAGVYELAGRWAKACLTHP